MGTICIPTSIIFIPADNNVENEQSIYNSKLFLFEWYILTWGMSFYMHVWFVYPWACTLYLQVRCIGLITMKPGNEMVIHNTGFFYCMLYLTCIASFCMWEQSVYPRVWSLSTPACNILENEKSICNTRFFYLHAVFNVHCEFLYGHMICILAGIISICVGMFSIPTGVSIPAGTICIPAGMIGNQIKAEDACQWFFLYTGVNFLPAI